MRNIQPSSTEGIKAPTGLMPTGRELTGSQALAALVKELVEGMDWPQKNGQFRIDEVQCFPARNLMILELYCCAKGAESSEAIEEWASKDVTARSLFENILPEAQTMIRFRKRHHAEIHRCLLQIFEIALQARFGSEQSNAAPIDYCAARALDSWFNPKCGPRPSEEANLRMDTLMYVDGWSDT